MTFETLVSEIREGFLDDKVEPYLWSTSQLTRFANEACREACIRKPLIERAQTLKVLAAKAEYTLNEYTRRVYTMQLALETRPLAQTTEAQLDTHYGRAWCERTGTPRMYVRKGKKLILFPEPVVPDTLTVTAGSLPDDYFDLDDDIPSSDHDALKLYVAYKAFMKPDADTYNPVKAADFLKMFNDYFGYPKTGRYYAIAFDNPLYDAFANGRIA